ncbi:hypothetical protein NE303_11035 [Levilactobacillus brevis]|uniref:hypothetical protein n=1 Tax=Levilactobacillus brevis TaxID=1580 RepID=UPI0020745F7C|nr:hypothetical protein [Levilactobacillus brevis]MCM6799418.1 hypothetical protein [Levilactobacillus brevis]MCM6801883.1 hypothetical protein [Levilactobacillus brevis]MCM6806577.1 hypothetical protein [Levilactobacillus brevis]MCM6807460.1 hypothetical protein [Levilactobacillus brevis]MCM6813344.1 hypothetical protein [Levilactobacillus brevis]
MATPNVGILTTAGKALIDKVNSGQAKISFSKIVFSSMDNSQLSDMQVKALTAIAPQEVVVSSPETTLDTNSGETRIRATGTNEKLADGVYVKTYGVFAKDDTGSEILYGVTVSPNPNYFPAYDGVTPQAVTYSYKTVIQETSNITMTNSNDVYVSQEDLTEAIAAIPKPDLSNYATNRQLATKADDSKVVHSTDMRKPASDVAGIEEVNAKQDKIGYTPADDSKVVHTSAIDPSVMVKRTLTADDDVLGLDPGTYYVWGGIVPKNYPTSATPWGIVVVKLLSNSTNTKLAEVFDTFNHQMINIYQGYPVAWSGWRAPNSGIMASKSDVSAATANKADDSKVAHLSGANNFDTTPTVNNNPLLLASSLPSDLARTSQQTNFTAGLKSGGVDVATAADLKSIKDSAWRPLTLKNSNSGTILFKDNGNGTASLTGSANFTVAKGTKTLTPAITPPTGYIFTSLNWNEHSYNNGVWANKYMGSGSSGVPGSFDTIISNGVICFLGQDDNDNPITFSPSELTTVNNSTACNPALVSISKV